MSRSQHTQVCPKHTRAHDGGNKAEAEAEAGARVTDCSEGPARADTVSVFIQWRKGPDNSCQSCACTWTATPNTITDPDKLIAGAGGGTQKIGMQVWAFFGLLLLET